MMNETAVEYCMTFASAIERSGLPANIVDPLLARYAAPGRHYHSLAHLERMFDMARLHEVALSQAQILAILFHDAVYDVRAPKGQNEERSAELLRHACTPFADKTVIDEAYEIVLCTITHQADTEAQREVVDLDLAGLALSMEEVQADSKNVFLEYQEMISWDDYKIARAKFFGQLLERPNILTSLALRRLEPTLRANLQAVIGDTEKERQDLAFRERR